MENEVTKEKIPMRRKGGVYVMELEGINMVKEKEPGMTPRSAA